MREMYFYYISTMVVTLVHHNTTFLLVQVPSILRASAGVFALEYGTKKRF